MILDRNSEVDRRCLQSNRTKWHMTQARSQNAIERLDSPRYMWVGDGKLRIIWNMGINPRIVFAEPMTLYLRDTWSYAYGLNCTCVGCGKYRWVRVSNTWVWQHLLRFWYVVPQENQFTQTNYRAHKIFKSQGYCHSPVLLHRRLWHRSIVTQRPRPLPFDSQIRSSMGITWVNVVWMEIIIRKILTSPRHRIPLF